MCLSPKVIHNNPHAFPLDFSIALCQYVEMVCIYCSSATSVTNSRHQKRLNQVWRRRRCLNCQADFTTHEIVQLGSGVMVGSPSSRKPQSFDADKLFISLYEACKHRKSAIADARGLQHTVIDNLRSEMQDGMVERSVIAAKALVVLGRFDPTAAALYRAYHRINNPNNT